MNTEEPPSNQNSTWPLPTMFSYHKLKKLQEGREAVGDVKVSLGRSTFRRWRWRWRWRRRPIRVRLARLVRRAVRRRASIVGAVVRSSVEKVVRRLKEGRPFVDELFAGNYLFMQVNPAAAAPQFDRTLLHASKLHHGHGVTPKSSFFVNTMRIVH